MLISEPTLPKCCHGIYLAGSVDGKSLYCGLCNPSRIIPNEQNVILPRSSADHLSNEGRSTANKHGSGCPACCSAIWLRTSESGSDTHRECAECGTRYKVRQSFHRQVQEMLAEMQATE
jgi:Zn ribbon nucleic-acid-binding protein